MNTRLGTLTIGKLERTLVNKVLDSNRLSYGPMTRDFERELATLHGVKHAIFMASGTCALEVGLFAWRELTGITGTIAIPAVTFIATMSTCLRAGYDVKLVDVDPKTFNMDPQKLRIAQQKNPNIIASMPVHLLGQSAPMEEYEGAVFEDCCESVGVRRYGKPVGSFGEFAAISTYVCHHITTGVGGALLTDNDDLATLARSLVQHGRHPSYLCMDDKPQSVDDKYKFDRWGFSYRSTELEAALGLAQLDGFEKMAAARRQTAIDMSQALSGFEFLQLPSFDNESIPLFYPLVCHTAESRDRVVAHLEREGVETRPLMPLVSQPPVVEYMEKQGVSASAFPVAHDISRRAFLIGCHPEMDVRVVKQAMSRIEP